MLLMPRLGRIFSLLPCFSLTAGHHCPFSSPMPRLTRIFSLLPCFFSAGGAPQASFCSLCPAQEGFSLFFPVFSLTAGHHSSFSSPMPRPAQIFSLLPCFFSAGGAPQASFCSLCPAQLGFSLFFPVFSLPAGHHKLPFAPHAPPASDFLSSSLLFL